MKPTTRNVATAGILFAVAGISEYLHDRWARRKAAWHAPLEAKAAVPEAASPDAAPAPVSPPRPHSLHPKALGRVALAAGKAWLERRAASKGAALALYTLFSLAPMLLLVVSIAGVFFGADTVRTALLEQVGGLTGSTGADAMQTILAGASEKDKGILAGAVSVVLLLVGATTAFAELKDSLDELWEVPPNPSSGIWGMLRERFLSFGLVLVLALMLMASLAVSTALAALESLWGELGSGTFHTLMQILSNLIGFLIVTALFAVIFKYLPGIRIAWRDVLVGALLTSVLFIAGKALIGWYIARGDISSTYGAAGSVVALITWIYYSAQIFFYGALFTHQYAHQLGSRAGKQQERVAAAK